MVPVSPNGDFKKQILRAKPSDFEYLRLIGKGSFGKVVLTRGKLDGKYYAVKILQKKVILNKKEQKHIMAERNVLLKNVQHPFLVCLHYSFQTSDKLFFVLDFINGGEATFTLALRAGASATQRATHQKRAQKRCVLRRVRRFLTKIGRTKNATCCIFVRPTLASKTTRMSKNANKNTHASPMLNIGARRRCVADATATHISLFFHLQRERYFAEPRALFYAAEIGSALGYLHSIEIIYRYAATTSILQDLKPENILLDSKPRDMQQRQLEHSFRVRHLGHIVLTDFGLCKEGISNSDKTLTFCGTPEYLAPEVIKKQPYDNTVDWWCLGSVLFEMLHGLPPFYHRDTAVMYENILHKCLVTRPDISITASFILEELLEKDPKQRLGSKDDFNEIKNHPFFSSINWTDMVEKKISPPYDPHVGCFAAMTCDDVAVIWGYYWERDHREEREGCEGRRKDGPDDISNFDTEFTDVMVPDSVCISTDYSIVNASVEEADDAFVGFSYAAPSDDFSF
ncbi:unnamed protein product [Ranitomeya imitator]|uniref:Uncharacterized protein n=1 Tax=Ranitomeya imitator TaxID=111125 RepID=A0ABN9MID0_9NEOB|nr:unnamed protein product [Ranitomeya imitator]